MPWTGETFVDVLREELSAIFNRSYTGSRFIFS
jgi:hypothetical protein